jgi:hypothetical protein
MLLGDDDFIHYLQQSYWDYTFSSFCGWCSGLHLISFVWGIPVENWLRGRAGLSTYAGGRMQEDFSSII